MRASLFILPTLCQLIKLNSAGQHWFWVRGGTGMCDSSSLLEMRQEEQIFI